MELSDHSVYYASGTTLAMFPTNGSFMFSADLKDQSKNSYCTCVSVQLCTSCTCTCITY